MCIRIFSLFELYPEHLALRCSTFPSSSPTSSCDFFAVGRFWHRLSSEISTIGKPLLMMQYRQFLQRKFSVFSHISRMKATDGLHLLISIPVASELILPQIRTRQCRVPTINHGRETALPYPLYYSGAAGIDIKHRSKSRHFTNSVSGEVKP